MGQADAGREGHPGVARNRPDGQEARGDLQDDDSPDKRGDPGHEASQRTQVKEQADGDEKKAVEDVLERQDVRDDLVAVRGFGDSQPGQERAQGQGEAERGRGQGHSQA